MHDPAAVLAELLRVLRLEPIERRIFRGPSQDLGWGAVFGGQVLGQALSAAAQTVTQTAGSERDVHSLHSYFLRQGDVKAPIVYEVEMVRDGGSFSTRRVVAVQHGEPIFVMSASFQKAEPGYDHHDPMPSVPTPEELPSEIETVRPILEKLPPAVAAIALAVRPIEMCPVEPLAFFNATPRPAVRRVWYRAAGALPDDPAVHRYLLAYASDFNLLTTALQPHGVSLLTPGMQVASLDHAMFFHRPFRFDDWLLYDIESPSASGARGLTIGRFYTRAGVHVATVVQEGLIRNRKPRQGP